MSSQVEILTGDCLQVLATLPEASVQCCVTSPPYWGLRDYGVDGQLGLEKTPEEYVSRMVSVFREVRRVLRDDGTLWLNLGDSYAAGKSGRDDSGNRGAFGGPRIEPKQRKAPAGYKSKDLVGIPWLVAFALRSPYERTVIKSREDRAWLAALIDGEGCITTTVTSSSVSDGRAVNESYAVVIQVRMCDRECLEYAAEITGMSHAHPDALPPSHVANNQRPSAAWRIYGDNAATILAEVLPYLKIKRKQAIVAWNLQRLKDEVETKRGVPIPADNMEKRRELHRIIRALNQRQPADIPTWCREPQIVVEPGWYLRSDCIWAKPNPMPESVRDRPTKAHEYLFLLTKSERYYYDVDAVKEPSKYPDDNRKARGKTDQKRMPTEDVAGIRPGSAIYPFRNRRTVWTITPKPFKGAHFATMPPDLVRPCILAGSRPGDTVLDPFNGAGTTGLVAVENGRKYIGIELNPEYVDMTRQRLSLPHGVTQ